MQVTGVCWIWKLCLKSIILYLGKLGCLYKMLEQEDVQHERMKFKAHMFKIKIYRQHFEIARSSKTHKHILGDGCSSIPNLFYVSKYIRIIEVNLMIDYIYKCIIEPIFCGKQLRDLCVVQLKFFTIRAKR